MQTRLQLIAGAMSLFSRALGFGVGAPPRTYSIYQMQVGTQGMSCLIKGGTLIRCLQWYIGQIAQPGAIPIWCVCFVVDNEPGSEALSSDLAWAATEWAKLQ